MNLLTVKELAALIKAKPSTIYLWAEQGAIPSCKLNGLLRFDEAEIIQWIQAQKNIGKYYNGNVGRRPRKGGQ